MELYPEHDAPTPKTDSKSTALVIQALVAMGLSPTQLHLHQSGHTPVTTLLSFLVTSGRDTGAFWASRDGTAPETSSPPIK